MSIEPNMLLAINSQQMHGTQFLISGVSFMSIQFEKEFLQELAYGIYGTREIIFSNTTVEYDNELTELIETYIKEHKQKREGYYYISDNLSIQIAVKIFRKLGMINHSVRYEKDESEHIGKAIDYLKQKYSDDFSFEEISQISNMNKFKLIRKFKENTGMTPYEHYMDIRIMKALEYLNNPAYKIIDVAFMCGFKNHSHFLSAS